MAHLPFDIKMDIFRRLGHHGFTNLGAVIAAGREGRDAVFTTEVMREVCLDEFMFYGALALEGSAYRPFLLKCIQYGNKEAKYIEGVRLMVQEEAFLTAYNYLNESISTNMYACFALSMFSFCSGSWEEGFGVLQYFWELVATVDKGVEVAEMVLAQITTMSIPPTGKYEESYEYPEVPWCVYVSCNAQDVCNDCFPFWYSRRVCGLC